MDEPIISLCLPTNGISEWVFPVLDSIYNQHVEDRLFEVVVTDNGSNYDFYDKMIVYMKNHTNLVYKKTNAYMFYNQIEALNIASGTYLKFVNHRGKFLDGSLIKMINIIKSFEKDKPVIYFSNGALNNDRYELNDFDSFVANLGRYASWTTGVGIWKTQFKSIPNNIRIDKISPHSFVLFSEKHANKYIIENFTFSEDIDRNQSKKGTYDLFKAFGVEEVTITLNLFIDGDITARTFKKVKKDYEIFVSELYLDFVLMHKQCSYILSGFDDAMGIFYNKNKIRIMAIWIFVKRQFEKIKRKLLIC